MASHPFYLYEETPLEEISVDYYARKAVHEALQCYEPTYTLINYTSVFRSKFVQDFDVGLPVMLHANMQWMLKTYYSTTDAGRRVAAISKSDPPGRWR